jgi:cystathionine beta-lyase/cystathionine gamma-synthase
MGHSENSTISGESDIVVGAVVDEDKRREEKRREENREVETVQDNSVRFLQNAGMRRRMSSDRRD